jgi:hypothetical protein
MIRITFYHLLLKQLATVFSSVPPGRSMEHHVSRFHRPQCERWRWSSSYPICRAFKSRFESGVAADIADVVAVNERYRVRFAALRRSQ